MKSDRRQRVIHDKYMTSSLCNLFIENSSMGYVPEAYITIDEQILPFRARCRLIQ